MAKRPATDRFRDAAALVGVEPDIIRFGADTRTAHDAAAAIGCEVAQIVKSLVFELDARPLLVLTSGANQVDTDKLGQLLGGRVGRADPAVVREATGFAIGGVPPFGHLSPVRTVIDRDLLEYEVVYGAAGAPDSVFPIRSAVLVDVTAGLVAEVATDR